MLPAKLRTLRAMPISSFTASGNSNKSLLADPIQNSGFSPGVLVGRTITIIPVLGYSVHNYSGQALTRFGIAISYVV
jgi:hypothetical protein